MSKMPANPDKKWPGLKAYWEAYGHSIPWEDLFDYRERSYDGLYVVVAWKDSDDQIGFADLASGGGGTPNDWEMQNDSERCTPKQWKTLRAYQGCGACDGFTMPEEDDD